jgi:hypothetical protein
MAKIIELFKKKLNFYSTIDDLPVYNWFQIQKTNDLVWLLKESKTLSDDNKIQLEAIWREIYFEFLDTFGIPEQMKEILSLKRDIAVLNARMYIDSDSSLLTFIEIKEYQLAKLTASNEVNSVGNVRVYVEKFMGFKLNEKEISVKEFYQYIDVINKDANKKISNG